MAKYIDADLLMKEIEHRIDILAGVSTKHAKNDDTEMYNYYHGKAVSLEELLSFIGSLNRRSILDFPITDKDIKEFLATHPKIKVPEKYKNPDWLLKKQEQPEKKEVKFVFPKFLYARTRDNNTIDVSYAPQDMNAIEYIRKDMVVDAIKLAYGKVSMNPFDHSEAFEELLNKI